MKTGQVLSVAAMLLVASGVVVWLAGYQLPGLINPESGVIEPKPKEEIYNAELDFYTENPMTLDMSGPQPKVVIEETTFNFGRMTLGSTQEHDFIIRNEGEAPLKLAKGRSQCKCTVSGLQDEEIPPGGEAKIHLKWKPTSSGEFHQGAIVYTNDPQFSEVKVYVEGDMYREVEYEPPGQWVLGTISSGTTVEFEGVIYSSVIESFDITEIVENSDEITVEFEPMSESELENRNALCGFNLHGQLEAGDKAGKLQEEVIVRTNLEKDPDFKFQVTAARSGPVVMVGPGWYAENQILRFGKVDVTKGKQVKLTAMVEPGGEPWKLTDIVSQPQFIELTLQAEDNPATAKRERYTLIFNVPAGVPPGNWPLENPASVRFKTNHPKIPEYQIDLEMTTE